jgi:hypothetical protein
MISNISSLYSIISNLLLTKPQATKSRSDDIINLNQPLFFVLFALFFGAAQQRLLTKSQSDDIINLNQPLFFVLFALLFGAAQQRLTKNGRQNLPPIFI